MVQYSVAKLYLEGSGNGRCCVIQNNEQLGHALEQIERLYHGLDALCADILPKNARNFAILAEGPLDEIHKLQAEIDDYIGGLDQVNPA